MTMLENVPEDKVNKQCENKIDKKNKDMIDECTNFLKSISLCLKKHKYSKECIYILYDKIELFSGIYMPVVSANYVLYIGILYEEAKKQHKFKKYIKNDTEFKTLFVNNIIETSPNAELCFFDIQNFVQKLKDKKAIEEYHNALNEETKIFFATAFKFIRGGFKLKMFNAFLKVLSIVKLTKLAINLSRIVWKSYKHIQNTLKQRIASIGETIVSYSPENILLLTKGSTSYTNHLKKSINIFAQNRYISLQKFIFKTIDVMHKSTLKEYENLSDYVMVNKPKLYQPKEKEEILHEPKETIDNQKDIRNKSEEIIDNHKNIETNKPEEIRNYEKNIGSKAKEILDEQEEVVYEPEEKPNEKKRIENKFEKNKLKENIDEEKKVMGIEPKEEIDKRKIDEEKIDEEKSIISESDRNIGYEPEERILDKAKEIIEEPNEKKIIFIQKAEKKNKSILKKLKCAGYSLSLLLGTGLVIGGCLTLFPEVCGAIIIVFLIISVLIIVVPFLLIISYVFYNIQEAKKRHISSVTEPFDLKKCNCDYM